MLTKIDNYVINKVREMRIAQKMSQVTLANELGISPGFIGKIESNKYSSHYNINHLNSLAKILKCSPQEFLPERPL